MVRRVDLVNQAGLDAFDEGAALLGLLGATPVHHGG